MQMASPESCFQAATSESCLEEIRLWMPDSNAMCLVTLREAIENLCIKTLSLPAQLRMAELGPLNLFAVVSCECPSTVTVRPMLAQYRTDTIAATVQLSTI